MLVKNEIIMDTCRGLDSAIDTTMDGLRNTEDELDNSVKVSRGETYTLKYAYSIATDWKPPEMLKPPFGAGGAHDYRQSIRRIAENLFRLMQMQVQEFRRLRNILDDRRWRDLSASKGMGYMDTCVFTADIASAPPISAK